MGYALSALGKRTGSIGFRAAIAGFCVLQLARPADAGSATLTVGTNADWVNLPGTMIVRNFPLLVRFDSAAFDFRQARSDGSDLRFATLDNKPLYHQIDAWDQAAGRAAVWVRLDSLKGGTTRAIRMFWGNQGPIVPSEGSKVFDTADGFLGVWHLQEKADTAAGRFQDATSFGRHGTGYGLAAAGTVPGIIGNTQTFDPAKLTYINLGDVGAFRDSAFTVSMWVKGPGNQADMRIFSESGAASAPLATLGTGTGSANPKMDFFMRNDADAQLVDHARTKADVFDGTWHHVALVRNLGDFALFVDGVADAKGTFKFDTLFSSTRTLLGAILRSSLTHHFTGNIDEVQISRVARSPEYLRALYESQKDGQSMVGPPIPDGCKEQFGTGRDTIRVAESSSASVSGMAACALRAGWWKVAADSALSPLPSQGLVLGIVGDRVSKDSTYRLRFRALYGDVWRSKDVVVRIIENVPDPAFSLPAPQTWNGLDSLSLQPIILNLDAINAGPAPAIRYTWSVKGLDVAARENPRSLTLAPTYLSGTLVVGLCLDNGGAKVCKSATLNVQSPSALAASVPEGAPAAYAKGFIEWRAPARIRVVSAEGKILLDRRGRPGQKAGIPSGMARALDRREARILITTER